MVEKKEFVDEGVPVYTQIETKKVANAAVTKIK